MDRLWRKEKLEEIKELTKIRRLLAFIARFREEDPAEYERILAGLPPGWEAIIEAEQARREGLSKVAEDIVAGLGKCYEEQDGDREGSKGS